MPIKNDIPPEVLRSFLAVAKCGSVSEAAGERGLTQSAISFQMKRLQSLLGGAVFIKTPRGLGLSYLGAKLERYAQRILVLNEQAIGLSGRSVHNETFHLGIQSIFSGKLIASVVSHLPGWSPNGPFRFDCGTVYYLADKLASGFLDLVFMCGPQGPRRNVLAEWNESFVWVCAPEFARVDEDPIPFVGREEGFIDRIVIDALDERDVAYSRVFTGNDLTPMTAAVEAGLGVMVSPSRVVPPTLVIAKDPSLPKLPDLRAGIFYKEGFDLKRNAALVEAFMTGVAPPHVRPTKISERRQKNVVRLLSEGAKNNS
jgi:DNA-binding transcriptional LysR family regulator